jgi:hypothetical protein
MTVDTSEADPLMSIACAGCGEKLRVERKFDHFVVVETLGIGGIGTVYKARDTLLDRLVALKLLRRDLSSEKDHASRFQHEARIAASVNHPNVIQIFSSGTDHDQFYVVMELVERGSLDDLIEGQKWLPEAHVLESGIQVAKGLRAAHKQGLIHRDVKPANILYIDEHTEKISDFGLAGVAGEGSETRAEIWGTPYYVAPERLSKQPEDFRGDIYSLGATLFHAVTGKAPIEGNTNVAAELLDLKKQPADLRRVAPELSDVTASVLQRMIAFNPDQRFSSYDELLAELEQAQRALLHGYTADLGRSRFRNWVSIGAALFIILAAAATVFFARKTLKHGEARVQATASAPLVGAGPRNASSPASLLKQPSAAGAGQMGRKIPDAEAASWSQALADYRARIGLYNFAGAVEAIKNAKVSDPSLSKAKEAAEKRARWLLDWRNSLIYDLNRTRFTGAISDTSGGQYTGIISATDQSLSLRLSHGIARVAWTKLSPKMLLTVSTSFIRSGAPEAADRRWRCAVFASEFGQTELARQLAELAAKSNSEYRGQISALFPEVPQRQ